MVHQQRLTANIEREERGYALLCPQTWYRQQGSID
jgi:hypothetical protein